MLAENLQQHTLAPDYTIKHACPEGHAFSHVGQNHVSLHFPLHSHLYNTEPRCENPRWRSQREDDWTIAHASQRKPYNDAFQGSIVKEL